MLDLPSREPMLLVDGRIAVPLPLDRPRPDLPFETGEATPCFGFRLSLTRLGDALRAVEPGFMLLDGEPHEITLLSGELELGHRVLRWQRRLGGKLERIVDGQAIGWATESEPLEPGPAVEVLLDGTRWHTVAAAIPRADLSANGVGTRLAGGAFRCELPTRSLTGAAEVKVELRPAHAREVLAGTARLEGLAPWRPDRGALLDLLPPDGMPPVSIVVPVYNAAEDVARCVESVLRHTTGLARLLLIDDASPDPAIAALFTSWEGLPGIELHRQPSNLGFTATCNRGFALAGRDDVVLLNSDTQVGPGWLDGLRLAAHAAPRVGTVTAVSNNAGVFSVPEPEADNRLPGWFTVADMARLARQAALALWPAAPTGNGFCLYVRRACLDVVGGFDEAAFPRGYGEENDFCMRASAAGFEHRVDDRTWVWHRRSASFGRAKAAHVQAGQAVLAERYPEYRALIGLFHKDPGFLALRWRVRRAVETALAQGTRPRPRVLYVISTESGGTPQTNRDLMEALADRYEPWMLRCDGRIIELTRHGAAAPEESRRLERPISPATHTSAEYDRNVADLLLRHGFELVHVRHIAWHGIGLPQVCRALGIPIVFSFHDFYTMCPTIKLLDGEGRFCGGRCTQGPGECVAELWPTASMPPLRGRFVHRWRAIMARALDACDAFVTTSPGARDTLLNGLPFLAGRDFRLIQHGRSFARLLSLAAEPASDEPLRVLVPGNISAAKGAAIVAALAAHDLGREIEFHVLGAVDGTLEQPRAGVVLHGRYERENFAERVATIGPHLAVILSTWPETYCHTLTECWAAGIPVLGSAIGAVGERISADGGGWLVDQASPPEVLHALLLRLKDDGADLRARREEVRRWQRRIGRHYDTSAMAVAYDLLYRDLLQRRRSFAAALPEPSPRVVLALRAAPRPDDFRLPLPTDNDVARAAVFRSISATYPFGDPAAGLGDVVLIGEAAGRPRDLVSLAEQCARAVLPLQVESDASPAGAATRAAQAAAGAKFLVATPLAAMALRRGGYQVGVLPTRLDPARWLPPPNAELPAISARRAPCRLLGFADDPGLEALRPMLEDLRLLDVADYLLVGAGGLSLGRDPVAGLRGIARGCDAALFPLAVAADEPRALALRACGLVLLRNRVGEEEPGETADGQLVLPQDPDAWLMAIAELSASAPWRQALARRTRRAVAAQLVLGGQAELLDRTLIGCGPAAGRA
ncbi:glycosyltransferase [Falsiroseomonas sp. E2-1-a20]|uniref:glycosyltransferase n=1 Tax=Falsiroseomonas sp. E2-1-a20 TaxID=3239300 RepID=UPI003F414547